MINNIMMDLNYEIEECFSLLSLKLQIYVFIENKTIVNNTKADTLGTR